MSELKAEQFADFFRSVHGYDPFPWQEKLARQVCDAGWPAALDIPTGAGKTAAIDIAVFHLALEADLGAERRAAVRTLFVVDRRLIVDDAYERAQHIAEQLARAEGGVLKDLADRLRLLAEDASTPLRVVRLRGGMPKEPDWVRTPAQPTMVISTVDQVGSRLLFRGYGVSNSMKPIHAGLLGGDVLLLLDEAHLSQPFLQTVRDSFMFRRAPWCENRAPALFSLVTLSATHGPADLVKEPPFAISDEDRTHPQLAPRLVAAKPIELLEERSEEGLERRLADKAWELSTSYGSATVIAVVVNRVRRARAIFEALLDKGALSFDGSSDAGPVSAPEAALLIGRVRPIDRDRLMDTLLRFVRAVRLGETRPPRGNPLIIVATQCIEAGADLDFDALLSEIAPLDCLRQRFGRLNRMGRQAKARGAIVGAADQVRKSAAADPIYGEALKNSWNLLIDQAKPAKKENPLIDFGIEASQRWFPHNEALKECLSPKKDAPILMPVAVELWGRTSPIPHADPEVSLYLHGRESGVGDVSIVWRADLDDQDFDDHIDDEKKREQTWTARVGACPPSALEAVSVPLGEAKNWLLGRAAANFPDTDAAAVNDKASAKISRKALRWRGAEDSVLVSAGDLAPGDVLVVPSLRGGCDRWGWNPDFEGKVADFGWEANQQQRAREILRLNPAARELNEPHIAELDDAMADWSDQDLKDHFKDHFENIYGRETRRLRVVWSDARPLAIERRVAGQSISLQSLGDAATEDDASVRSPDQKPVLLSHHSQGVEGFARDYAAKAGLSTQLIEDLALSGYLHDAGKAHPDFKRFLYGGDELAAMGSDLAKSARLPANPREWNELRLRSKLPRGARHEVASLRFAEAHQRLQTAYDPDLVIWLVGTHHGYGRPFFPAPERAWPREGETFETDLGDGTIRALPAIPLAILTAHWLELAERLTRRYGTWGLARLEAILRLADHRESEREQQEGATE